MKTNRRFRRYKLAWRLLDNLRDAAPLSTNRGRMIRQKYVRPTGKVRRHYARRYPLILGPQRVLDEEGIFIDYYIEPWNSYDDGIRDTSRLTGGYHWSDRVWAIPLMKARLRKQREIRKARKQKLLLLNGKVR